jgi:putative (di)nucleoside polyphosphate hydrolase
MSIDRNGFRKGVAMIVVNNCNRVLWAKRIHQEAWQFPQGGLMENESPEEAVYRELHEEVGLQPKDISVIANTKNWLYYRLPVQMIRHHSQPICIGQKQKWYLLRLLSEDKEISFDTTDKPEFEDYRWVYYWLPLKKIVPFKRRVYREALREFSSVLFKNNALITDTEH